MLGTPRRGERRAKKWRVSTQNGERACEAPFSPFLVRSSASLRRRHFGGRGRRRRCSRGVTRKWKWREREAPLSPSVSVSRKMSALKCPSLSSRLRARREASCLEVLLQLRWSFVRLSTSRGGRDTNNNVLKETGRSDRRLFRVLREKQSLCGLGWIEAAHRGFQRRARGFHVGQTNRTGAGVRLKCETKRRCRQTGEEGGKNLLISSNRFT